MSIRRVPVRIGESWAWFEIFTPVWRLPEPQSMTEDEQRQASVRYALSVYRGRDTLATLSRHSPDDPA